MTSVRQHGVDVTAAIAAAIAAVMTGVYVALIRQEGGHVAAWFLVGMTAAALLSAYGAVRGVPRRNQALAASGLAMLALGLLGILTIGLPILAAGALALIAAGRATPDRPPA